MAEQKRYWKSIKEYSGEPEFMDLLSKQAKNEFPENYDRPLPKANGMTRRTFMGLLTASMALTAAACRRPDYKIVPSVRAVEYIKPGIPNFYTSVYSDGNAAVGIEVKTREGRPVKIEGNAEHPVLGGKSSAAMQAALLALYDPDRMSGSRRHPVGARTSSQLPPDRVLQMVAEGAQAALNNGKGVRILIGEHASPSLDALMRLLETAVFDLKFVTMTPGHTSGAAQAARDVLGVDAEMAIDYSKADVILAVDSDFLGTDKYAAVNTRQFAANRQPSRENPVMSRLIVAESIMSLTGMNADDRIKIGPDDVEKFLAAVLKSVAGSSVDPAVAQAASRVPDNLGGDLAAHAKSVAGELTAPGKRGLVSLGAHHSAAAHAMALAINLAVGAVGEDKALDPFRVFPFSSSKAEEQAQFRADLKNGSIGAVIFADVNPFYWGDKELRDGLEKVPTRVAFTSHEDETAGMCEFYIPSAHSLESWGDALTCDGTLAIQQPMIAPLNSSSMGMGDFLMALAKNMDDALAIELENIKLANELSYDLDSYIHFVRARWEEEWWNSDDVLADTFSRQWELALRHGAYQPVRYRRSPEAVAPQFNPDGFATVLRDGRNPSATQGAMTCVVAPDPKLAYGMLANNGWLQELPDPVTKVTWDNVAAISIKTAASLGVDNEDVIAIENANGSIELPVLIQPGMADNVIHTTTGYGRTRGGVVQEGVGANAFTLLAPGQAVGAINVNVTSAGRKHPIATTQQHHTLYQAEDADWRNDYNAETYNQDVPKGSKPKVLERREILQETTLSKMKGPREEDLFHMPHVPGMEKDADLFTEPVTSNPPFQYKGHRWGMTIDLSKCTGCNSCVVACQAENNIAVVGKDQVLAGRELHWIRLDRYYSGDPEAPQSAVQLMTCQHCENAPCENVCPVAATTHSPEGLNEMTYNRCVGTRYCLNNCPYKVRRFNFLNYHKGERSPIEMAFNPDVTVRMRGIMEKCTFCIQRINKAKWEAKDQGRARVQDGGVVTACQQACPADAILFGDVNDPNSAVSAMRQHDRGYLVLRQLNVKPQITYLAKVRADKEGFLS